LTPFDELPSTAAWRHVGGREGFEVVTVRPSGSGYQLRGHAVAAEGDDVWAVGYVLAIDAQWRTEQARVWGWSTLGEYERVLVAAGPSRWTVDGRPVRALDGCLDVDLEASACTNTVPIHRLGLDVGEVADAPAVYLRARDFGVERLDQTYARVTDDGEHRRYAYEAPAFGFQAGLVVDRAGLVLDYPGIAVRAR
jgi:uncharacterized protein